MELGAHTPLVLLAEPDAMVATDLGDALEHAGYRVLGPYATTPEAMAAMDRESPALAVLDVKLKDGFCCSLGGKLKQRRIPFVVHSGYPSDEPRATGFDGAPWLSKPALTDDVVVLLHRLASVPAAEASIEAPTKAATVVRIGGTVASKGNPLIRKMESLVTLTDADRAILERISENSRPVGPRVDLVREGDAPDGVFLVMDGMACRHKFRADGSRQIMAYLLPGDLSNLDVGLLDRMDHGIATLTSCQVARIAPETVAEVMRDHPSLATALRLGALVDRATLREWLVNIGRRSALERIAHLFCEMFVRLEAVGLAKDGSYALRLTQADLADTTGLTTVHVNRCLQELRRLGLIELKGGRLRIPNLARLRSIAEFSNDYLLPRNKAVA